MYPFVSFLIALMLGPLVFFVSPEKPTAPALEAKSLGARVIEKLLLAGEYIPPERLLDETYLPLRDWNTMPPNIDARAAVVTTRRSGKTLYERNFRERRQIASLTKLATALVIVEELPLDEEIVVSKRAVTTEGDFGSLVVDEKLTVRGLLAAMLVTSSNDAAIALEEHLVSSRGKNLIQLMNAKAHGLELLNTNFSSVHGLNGKNNFSTAEDIARLLRAALEHPVLRELLGTDTMDISSTDGKFSHRLVTSNRLLGRFDGIMAGKTGFTQGAGGTLAVLAKNPQVPDDDFIAVILGSTNEETRFEAMEKLITWVNEAYRW